MDIIVLDIGFHYKTLKVFYAHILHTQTCKVM